MISFGLWQRSNRQKRASKLGIPCKQAINATTSDRVAKIIYSDGCAGGVSDMTHVTPFFGFTLALVIPGANHPTCSATVDRRTVVPGSRRFPPPAGASTKTISKVLHLRHHRFLPVS
jgi:hypothetical protein